MFSGGIKRDQWHEMSSCKRHLKIKGTEKRISIFHRV